VSNEERHVASLLARAAVPHRLPIEDPTITAKENAIEWIQKAASRPDIRHDPGVGR
jgi:hypothetical protein